MLKQQVRRILAQLSGLIKAIYDKSVNIGCDLDIAIDKSGQLRLGQCADFSRLDLSTLE